MATANQFEVGARYVLSTYIPHLLGTFEDVRVDGIVDISVASNYIDPHALHANVFGAIPSGKIIDNPSKYFYVLLTLPNGTKTALGLPWIQEDTVEKKEYYTAQIFVEDVSPDDYERLRRALVSNGFKVGDIKID